MEILNLGKMYLSCFLSQCCTTVLSFNAECLYWSMSEVKKAKLKLPFKLFKNKKWLSWLSDLKRSLPKAMIKYNLLGLLLHRLSELLRSRYHPW